MVNKSNKAPAFSCEDGLVDKCKRVGLCPTETCDGGTRSTPGRSNTEAGLQEGQWCSMHVKRRVQRPGGRRDPGLFKELQPQGRGEEAAEVGQGRPLRAPEGMLRSPALHAMKSPCRAWND